MSVFILLLAGAGATASEQLPVDETIVVKGQNPLHSEDSDYFFGSLQSISGKDLQQSGSVSITDYLKHHLRNVHVNDAQNNPFQPDVQYRGFTASPLLGLPQGISVYLNGFRFNEPFGDTVNWDLIALSAIDKVQLFSGSNPLFGYNTLGGALALTVKDGFNHADDSVTFSAGSHGSQLVNMQSGGHNEHWGYYLNVNQYEEDGWRDASPTQIKQYLANISYQGQGIDAKLLLANNHNGMIGNGAVPLELLEAQSPTAIYTQPDQTSTAMKLVGLTVDASLSQSLLLSANAYVRENVVRSINGDDSDFAECETDFGTTLCEGDDDDDDHEEANAMSHDDDDGNEDEIQPVQFVGYAPNTPFSELSNLDPDDVDGTYNTGRSVIKSKGITLQLTKDFSESIQVTAGLSTDNSAISFVSGTEFAILHNESINDDRSVTPIGLFDQEAQVALDVDSTYYSAFVQGHFTLNEKLSLELGGRYQKATIDMKDLIESGEGSLDGYHKFKRFNPAVGGLYQINDQLLATLSYSESSRNPSPAELSCADENDPCKLPNGFVSDPPLEQVVVKTWEFGLSHSTANWQHQVTLFNTKSIDDIIFQQAGSHPSRGYFVNIDETRRQGIELASQTRLGSVDVTVNYSYLDATFESPFVSFSPQNPLGPNREVSPGDTIPGQPKHQLKLLLDYQWEKLHLGSELNYVSSSFYRGDEANENQKIGSHVLANLVANYQFSDNLSAALRVDNLFDRQYFTFGTYGEADEVLEDIYPDVEGPHFVGPAKPRSVSVSMNYRF